MLKRQRSVTLHEQLKCREPDSSSREAPLTPDFSEPLQLNSLVCSSAFVDPGAHFDQEN